MNNESMALESWEVEGRRLAPLLDGLCAVVVSAHQVEVAVQVALGLARVQGQRRRVAIADLIGESPALEQLIDGDDPHGLSDSFFYGVSLNKIARPMRGADNVFLMPSGTEPVDNEDVYANERWRRLAAGFHQVGALLIVVARPTAPGFASLCSFIGTLMPVGEAAFPVPPGIPLIGPPQPPPPPAPRTNPQVVVPASSARALDAAEEDTGGRRRRTLIAIVLIAAVAVAIGALWPQLVLRMPSAISRMMQPKPVDSAAMVVPPTPMDTMPKADSTLKDSLPVDSLGRVASDSALPAAAAPAASPPPPISNPADSASAARYAIYFTSANTRDAAMPDDRMKKLDAVAVSPVMEGAERWYRLTIGALPTRADAEALLVKFRSERMITSGSIVAVPLAFQLDKNVGASELSGRLSAWRTRGLVPYALRQGDGRLAIYTGAFETPTQGTVLADSLRATGVVPVMVYRMGRAF
jgi:hypothetical protein